MRLLIDDCYFDIVIYIYKIVNYQSEGGDPERRHETPWARDGRGSGTGWRFLILFGFCVFFLRRRVRAPAGPATHPRPIHDPPATHPRPTRDNDFSRTKVSEGFF